MYGYVCSKNGTFGTVHREYISETTGEKMVIVKWGVLGWLTPVLEKNLQQLRSPYERLARKEAENLVKKEND
jgi:hypothetical protein